MTKKTKLIILIPLIAAVLNGVGYLIAINLRTPPKDPVASSGGVGDSPPGAFTDRLSDDHSRERTADRPGDERDGKAVDKVKEEKALARRAAGLAALEAGDYERALANFAEARALAGDKAYVSELLRVTEDLARRAPAGGRRPPISRPAVPPPQPHFANRFRSPERTVAAKESPPSEAPPPPASVPAPTPAPTAGLLLVTTTPRGLLVQVDEVPVDLSPTRASLKIGSHHVALFDGDRKVYETNVDVKAGAPTTLLRDLSAELAPSMRPAPPAPFAKEKVAGESPRTIASGTTTPSSPSSTRGRAPMLLAPQSVPPPVVHTGSLEITSPGLYGEVWINGRPRGFPPLFAEDLPAGPTRVGVRVNGVEQRSTLVAVRPGTTTSVRLNRQESVP